MPYLRKELEQATVENTNYRHGPNRAKEKYYKPEIRNDKPKRKNNLRFPKGSAK